MGVTVSAASTFVTKACSAVPKCFARLEGFRVRYWFPTSTGKMSKHDNHKLTKGNSWGYPRLWSAGVHPKAISLFI